MPISSGNIRDILLPGLRATPEQRAQWREEAQSAFAAERAQYDALSASEKAEYDALTEGMMPRLRGANRCRNVMAGSPF